MSDWILTADEVPKLYDEVLGYYGDDIFSICVRVEDKWVDDDGRTDEVPFYWLEIPVPPKIPEPEPDPYEDAVLKDRWPSPIEPMLSDNAKAMIQEFQHYHEKDCENGRQYSYSVSATSGIGVVIEIQCEKCGLNENVTDYDKW